MGRAIVDTETQIRDISAGAVTASANSSSISFVPGNGDFRVVLHVTALDETDTDETYELAVQVDSAASFTSEVEVGRLNIASTGVHEILVSGHEVQKLEAGAQKLRIAATLGGTTPSITYGAFVAPIY